MDLECERELELLEQKQKWPPELALQSHQQHPAHARSLRAMAVQDVLKNMSIRDATKRDVMLCHGKEDSFHGPTFAAEFSRKFGEAFASSNGRSNDPFLAKTVEHAALTAFAFAIGEEDENGSAPTETQVKAKAVGKTIDLAVEASAELEDEEDAALMSKEAEDEAFLASPWFRLLIKTAF